MDATLYLILTTIAAAVTGAACGQGSVALARYLLRRRELDDALPPALRWAAVIGAALLFAAGWLWLSLSARLIYLLLMLVLGLTVSLTDIRRRIIPNSLILAIFLITAGFALTGLLPFDWGSSLLGMVICLVIFLLPAIRGGQIGMGDVKLAAAIGFASGLAGSLLAIILMGLLILFSTLFRFDPAMSRLKTLIPMGPFLMAAFMVVQVVI